MALQSAFSQVSLTQKHIDLIWAIWKLASSIPIDVEFEDVTAHLDDHHHFEDLDLPSQLNVQVDYEAKHYIWHLLSEPPPLAGLRNILMEGWSCWLGDTKVTTNLYPTIVNHIYWQKMKEHCQLKEGLEPEAFDLVEWDAIDDAANMLPMLFNLWKMKQVSGFWVRIWNAGAFGKTVVVLAVMSWGKMPNTSCIAHIKTE